MGMMSKEWRATDAMEERGGREEEEGKKRKGRGGREEEDAERKREEERGREQLVLVVRSRNTETYRLHGGADFLFRPCTR